MSDKNMANPKEREGLAEKRKDDHISLSFKSNTGMDEYNNRFYYEPMLSAFPKSTPESFNFLGKTMLYPLWISSMTGGNELAKKINQNLARAAKEYGLGMGLGSCRGLLYSDEFFDDFNIRPVIGDQPFYANLGIAQVAYLIEHDELDKIEKLITSLDADGLIVHINPLQEYMQPEGDSIDESPIDTITKLLVRADCNIIIKEVGQGMGYESIKAILKLPIEAFEFAAYGGTNFAVLEQLRDDNNESFDPLSYVGHTAEEMLTMVNEIVDEDPEAIKCKQLIISGGVKDYLDGYYLTQKSKIPAIYGQAGAFLKHARGSYETLQKYIENQLSGLRMAQVYLRIKS